MSCMDDVILEALLDLAFDPNQPRDSAGRWTRSSVRASIDRVTRLVSDFVRVDGGPDRKVMPQLSGVPLPGSKADALPHAPGEEVDLVDQFEKELRARGVAVEDTELRVSVLKPTQDQIIQKKVEGIATFMLTAPKDSRVFEPIFVTRDDYVVDGHHRWAAQYVKDEVLNTDSVMKVRRIGLNKDDAMKVAINFMDEWGLPRAGTSKAGPAISKFMSTKNLAVDAADVIDLADYSSLARPGYTGPRRTSDKERAIAHALMRKGKKKSAAIRMARGLLKKAAATGRWGDHGKASAKTRAAAVASIAQRKTF